MSKLNRTLAQLLFWTLLWWGIFEARFIGWATAWPWFTASLFVLAVWLLAARRLKRSCA